MLKRPVLFILALFVVMQTVACGSPWKVLRKSDPNPFSKQTLFSIGSAYYRGLQVGSAPEDVHKQTLTAGATKQWESDKRFFSRDYRKAVKANTQGLRIAARVMPKAFIVKPNVLLITIGNGKKNLKVKLQVRIEKKNSLYELIEMMIEVKPGEAPTFSQRFRLAGKKAGELTAKYLKERAK
jgi:hypothetical protein